MHCVRKIGIIILSIFLFFNIPVNASVLDDIDIENKKIINLRKNVETIENYKSVYFSNKLSYTIDESLMWILNNCDLYSGPTILSNIVNNIKKDEEVLVKKVYENNFAEISYNDNIYCLKLDNLTKEEPEKEEEIEQNIVQQPSTSYIRTQNPIIVHENSEFYFDPAILYDGVNIEEDYKGISIELSEDEKHMIMHMLCHEFGGDLGGCILVCQALRDGMVYNTHFNHGNSGHADVVDILSTSFSPHYASDYRTCNHANSQNSICQSNAEQAYNYIFVEGKSAVQHKLMCYGTDAVNFTFNPNLYRVLRYETENGRWNSVFWSWI